jgi:hypothetical protein
MGHHNRAIPETSRRVPANTDEEINRRIERQIQHNVRYYAEHPDEIPKRLAALDAEWDIERAIEANAGALALTGTVLTVTRGLRFLVIPAVVAGFLLQHAIQGWCPPVPILRRLGFRTAREIDRERNALKALRGDYEIVSRGSGMVSRPDAALMASSAGSAG